MKPIRFNKLPIGALFYAHNREYRKNTKEHGITAENRVTWFPDNPLVEVSI